MKRYFASQVVNEDFYTSDFDISTLTPNVLFEFSFGRSRERVDLR